MRYLLALLKRFHFFFFFLLLEVIAVLLIVRHTNYQRATIINATNELTGGVYSTFTGVTEYFSLKQTNERLTREYAELKNVSPGAYYVSDTGSFYVNDSLFKRQFRYRPAEIIAKTIDKRNNYLMMNKGSRMGVAKDMGVVSHNGIVGIVVGVSKNYCSVMSLLHKQSRISAKLKKNNQLGSVVWNGMDYRHATLNDIPNHVNINIGDTVITSGYSFIFPSNIMIGTVKKVELPPGENFYDITIALSTDFSVIRHGYIIENLMQQEQRKLQGETTDD
ncbi:MAG: rod shape-determining protein MreC [Bacteroidales bacterium]|nr:rod shape-determining protein MreC [Bacteroidales bacterium]